MKLYTLFLNFLAACWIAGFAMVLWADHPTSGRLWETIPLDSNGFIHELMYLFGAMVASFIALDWLHRKVTKPTVKTVYLIKKQEEHQ